MLNAFLALVHLAIHRSRLINGHIRKIEKIVAKRQTDATGKKQDARKMWRRTEHSMFMDMKNYNQRTLAKLLQRRGRDESEKPESDKENTDAEAGLEEDEELEEDDELEDEEPEEDKKMDED